MLFPFLFGTVIIRSQKKEIAKLQNCIPDSDRNNSLPKVGNGAGIEAGGIPGKVGTGIPVHL